MAYAEDDKYDSINEDDPELDELGEEEVEEYPSITEEDFGELEDPEDRRDTSCTFLQRLLL